MAGVKGKSGRKSRHSEIVTGNLEKVCNDYLLGNFESFPDPIKQKIALTIASKATTQRLETKNDTVITQKAIEEEKAYLSEFIRKYRSGLS